MRRAPALLLACAPFLLASCDVIADGDVFAFELSDVVFDFTVGGGTPGVGATVTVLSDDTEGLLAAIQDEGFGAADVVNVRTVAGSAELRVLSGAGDLSFLEEARLELRAGSQSAEAAARTGFPTDDDAPLTAGTDDLGAVVTAGEAVGAALRLTGAAAPPGGTYRLEARLDLRVEVDAL